MLMKEQGDRLKSGESMWTMWVSADLWDSGVHEGAGGEKG